MALIVVLYDTVAGRFYSQLVGAAQLAAASVLSSHIGSGQVGLTHLVGDPTSGYVLTAQGALAPVYATAPGGTIGPGSILSSHIGSGQIGTPHIRPGSILSAQIGANIIATPHIVNQGILSAALGSGQVGLTQLRGGPTSGQVLTAQGTLPPSWATSPAGVVISSGNYTGNDTQNRAIAHGLGKVPKIVFIHTVNYRYWYRINGSLARIEFIGTNFGYMDVTQPDATNFYVGKSGSSEQSANNSSYNHYWVALG